MIDLIAHSAREILQKVGEQEELNALREIKAVNEIYIIQLYKSLTSLTEINIETTPTDLYALMVMTETSATFIEEYTNQLALESPEVSGFINKAKNWFGKVLRPWLKNMWKVVWAMIQQKTTIKEWKVSGEVGTPIFGLGSAKIEITFG